MTDLGLAPGWVNILAEHGYNSHEGTPKTVDMMVGGLPIKPDNYLKYNCTWSHEGLINEYKDQCTVLTDGSIVLADGMSGLINIQTGLGVMEAFYTSGGASHTIETMQNRGVQDCNYRTIRHKGHCEALKFLINDCGLDDEGLIALLNTACPPAPDLVIVKVRVGAYKNIADWKEEKIVYSNDKFSAMQMATAFPISVVAQQMGISNLTRKIHLAQTHLIATNYYTRQGCYKFGGPLAYKDIPYEEFETKLEYLFEEAQ
jgi:saccharopine dehydrogenase-like NADP-dependent oxidoreductase